MQQCVDAEWKFTKGKATKANAFSFTTLFLAFSTVVVVGYPTPSEEWGYGGRPWSPRSRATPHGLDQRSYRDGESPKSERRKESVAGQCRIR